MKILIAPDSFKSTLSSIKISEAMKRIIKNNIPEIEVVSLPVADGGEGTLDCFSAIDGFYAVNVPVKDAHFRDMTTQYLRKDDICVIEMAKVAGFAGDNANSNPRKTSSYGVGLLARHAIENGCRKILVGLGGSSTNDFGTGLASALGVKFLNENGIPFIPVGETLSAVEHIDLSSSTALLKKVEITGLCDVTNPVYGLNGAAYVFGPQKGASDEDVVFLDCQLRAMSETIRRDLDIDVSTVIGGGAAGATGAGIHALLGGKLIRGIDAILGVCNFDRLLSDIDLVITGEGKFDTQSMDGKVVSGICQRAKSRGINVLIITGVATIDESCLEGLNISKVFETGALDFSRPKDEIQSSALKSLEKTTLSICDYIRRNKL